MTSESNNPSSPNSSAGSSKPSSERTVQSGSIQRDPIIDRGTGFDLPGGVSGLRTCYICYDDDGQRICNEIPCPGDVGDQATSGPPTASDAAGIASARSRKQKGAGASAQRSVQSGTIDRDAVLDRPVDAFDIPVDVSGLAEICYMCHTHEDGETVCHEITCP